MRGLPANQRILLPAGDDTSLANTSLHIVAIPANPISGELAPLDIAGEWQRLKEIVQSLLYAITLERAHPPTLDQLRRLVANRQGRVVHFMGHGGQGDDGAMLVFEDETAAPKAVTAQAFIDRLEDSAFFVCLNACVSATPGPTQFSNLAHALVQRGVPYALGMRFTVPDDDAKRFARALYDELGRGVPVERAVRQVRHALAESGSPWAVGVPVLYTSLSEPAAGFAQVDGLPRLLEHNPHLEVDALPRAEGAFQGRVGELLALGEALTGDQRPRVLTIHGGGGQGKTALAREAVERFAHAWPGGVWAVSLENLPSREAFTVNLARFLGLPLDKLPEAASLERALLSALNQRRVLIVLDNAETLVEAVEREEPAALDLAAFLRERLPGTLASLLVTSRASLGWIGEHSLELGGLTPAEGAALFRQSAPQRQADIQMAEAEGLSVRLDGHPLALRLLGLTFNTLAVSLAAFLAEHEAHLRTAHDKYKTADHRHRTLFASIETSVRHLGDDARRLLSGLWLFHAPFLPETAAEIFAPLDLALANPGTPPDETAIANRKSKIENRKSKISSSFSTSAACCNTSAAASRWPAGALPPAADHAPVRGAPPGPGV